MKAKEIKVGGVYSNGKGRLREVHKINQIDEYADMLEYIVVTDRTIADNRRGEFKAVTVQAFAQWAKERVE